MNKLFSGLCLFLFLLSFAALAFAQEDLPNDPLVNDDANACYTGGTMEGRCGTSDHDGNGVIDDYEAEWDFRCGWYLIRYQYRLIGRGNMPGDCSTILDFEPDTDGCNVEADFMDFDLLAGDTTTFFPSDNDCSFNVSGGGAAGISLVNITILGFSFVDIHTLRLQFRCNTAGQPWSIKGYYSDSNEGPIRINLTGNCI